MKVKKPKQGLFAALLSFAFLSLFACGDSAPPTLLSATLRETSRTLTLNFSETVNNTLGEVDLSKLFISEEGQSNQMPLTGARIVTEGNSETASIRLTEPQWQAASALMMPQLDVQASAVKDLGGNEIADSADIDIQVLGLIASVVKIDSNTMDGPMLFDFDSFGSSVANLGDLDGDNITDMAVGADGDDGDGIDRGTAHILFMNRDGSVKRAAEINSGPGLMLSNHDAFGRSVTDLGDLDNDDITELVVGVFGIAGGLTGAAHILFLNSNGSVKRAAKIDSNTMDGPTLLRGDNFGISVAALGDLDGDGITELAVGATGDDAGGTARGALHILFLNSNGSVKSTVEINSDTNGLSLSNGDGFGRSVANSGRSG